MTGDFTIDLWIYAESDTPYHVCPSCDAQGAAMLSTQVAPPGVTGYDSNGFVVGAFYQGRRRLYVTWYECSKYSIAEFSLNEWHHVAVVRSSNDVYIFLDGAIDGDATSCTRVPNEQQKALVVGSHSSGHNPFRGFVDELRISKGIARWTGGFTPIGMDLPTKMPTKAPNEGPPTAAPTTVDYMADEHTHLLMHFDGDEGSTDLVDDSDLGHQVDIAGGAAVTTARKKVGTGSVYFDGSGEDMLPVQLLFLQRMH